MPVEVILPKVDMDMTHGTFATWRVAEGQAVKQGEPLFDIETDKAAMEVEAPAAGHLHHLMAKPGDKVPVGTTIAWLYAEGEAIGPAPGAPIALAAADNVVSQGSKPQPVEVILPKVDMDMTHGVLNAWHVVEGETVIQGAPLFDIETDKAAMEVEAPATGRLHHLSAKPGDKVPVGTTIAWIYPEGAVVGPAPETVAALLAAPLPLSERLPEPARSMTASDPTDHVRATPAARKAARDAGLTLAGIPGTGPRGRIQRGDVTALQHRQPSREPEGSPDAAGPGWSPEPGPLAISFRNGTGRPLVLLHGFTADSLSWAPFEKALGGSRPLIRIDLPGHGKSPKRKIRNFADLSRMVVEAFDSAAPDGQEVHLVGHSLGAALALSLADIRGRRIASLTLISPAGLGPEIDAATLNGIARATRAESLGPWLRQLTATPAGISDDYARAAMRTRADPGLRACQTSMVDAIFPDGVQSFDLRPALSRLDLPAQILWGRQDHILPYRQAIAADGEFALHLLSGAGHIPQIECPDRVARIAQLLISAVDASG